MQYQRLIRGSPTVKRAPQTTDTARILLDIAHRISRLSPLHGNPETFYIAREEAARDLRRIAKEVA